MQVQVFSFENNNIRTQRDGEDVWFNASDVCGALGYANSRDAISKHVDAEDVARRDTPTAGGTQSSNHINESGLYALIFGSTLPSAKAFKRWVTSEVLPAIRNTGKFEVSNPVVQLPDFTNPAEAARAWALEFEAKTVAEALVSAQSQQLAIAAPKVAVYEVLADRKQDVSTTIVAKQLGTTAIKLNQFLRENGVKWMAADLPKAGYMEWFNVISDTKNGHEFQQCLVTPLGQLKIAQLWNPASQMVGA